MAIIVQTSNPQRLLNSIFESIDQGHIKTWAYDEDKDFIYEPSQWRGSFWLRPKISPQSSRLELNTVAPKNKFISMEDYAICHGRFIEMLLSHFDGSFQTALSTAKPTSEDKVWGE